MMSPKDAYEDHEDKFCCSDSRSGTSRSRSKNQCANNNILLACQVLRLSGKFFCLVYSVPAI